MKRTVVDGLNSEAPVNPERHPLWYPPKQSSSSVHGELRVLNSLTESLQPFVPREGRFVKWYTCGPTVYDYSHMGHARAYLTFDILRRIMEDYFGYNVFYQMNITDVDDKIIKRTRIDELLKKFSAEKLKNGTDFDTLKSFTEKALKAAEEGMAKREKKLSEPLPESAPSRAKSEREEKKKELELKKQQLQETKANVVDAISKGDFGLLFDVAASVNGELLDEMEGESITDQRLFEKHARFFENSFFEDMRRLGIRDPDVVTRVTEYIPKVVDFVERIMANGFAYKRKSSIYFDTEAFLEAGHSYPKLKPNTEKNATEDEMAEGEGILTKGDDQEKKSPNDFALWKFSKPGEPRWPSPWGEGRPGWHIECSVMASDILGNNIDIHSGGWDLKFPHHDNESAQSEAHGLHHQWINYFLHCGHLHIKGLKMSKSLKNFITIRQAIDELGVTPRTMRLLFLANSWHKSMNFSDQSIDEAKERERVLRAFFGSVDVILRDDYFSQEQGFNEEDRALSDLRISVEQEVHAALLNNFDTPAALTALMSLVSATNQYLLNGLRPSATLIRKIGQYITRMLRIFGVVDGTDAIGFGSGDSALGSSADARFVPIMDALTRFRDEVRDIAKANKMASEFLPLCDKLRDEWLTEVGIRLEDTPNGPTRWKTDDPVLLRKERAEREEAQKVEQQKKLVNQIEVKRKLVEKWKQFAYPPTEYFKRKENEAEESQKKYKSFDPETGLPTESIEGEAVTEKDIKKLQKELAKYAKQYEEFLSKGGAPWLQEQTSELEEMLQKINQ